MDNLIDLLQTDWGGVMFLILYTSLLFGGWAWMLSARIDPIKEGITEIKKSLNNHITDTNRKIETLNNTLMAQFKDHNKQVVDLYKVLIDKQNSK